MRETGNVVKVDGKYATVRIGRNSACASCGKCGMTDEQKYADFFVENTLDVKVGNNVEVDIPETNTLGIAFVAYAIPLIPALVLLFVALFVGWGDIIAVLMFFAGYALGLAIVVLIDKLRNGKWAEMPVMVRVVENEITVKEDA